MELNIEKIIKDSITKNVSNTIDEEIEKKVVEFRQQLLERKDKYIAEVMNGIRIFHEKDPYQNDMIYKIIFENKYRIGE